MCAVIESFRVGACFQLEDLSAEHCNPVGNIRGIQKMVGNGCREAPWPVVVVSKKVEVFYDNVISIPIYNRFTTRDSTRVGF